MPRNPGIWFRKGRGWFTTVDGKQIPLGIPEKTRRVDALRKLVKVLEDHTIAYTPAMGPTGKPTTIRQLSALFLNWCEKHRATLTFEEHERNLKRLVSWLPKNLAIESFKRHHVTQWLDHLTEQAAIQSVSGKATRPRPFGSGGRRAAINSVSSLFAWAVHEQYIDASPVARYPKPPKGRRDLVLTEKERTRIVEAVEDEPFRNVVEFLIEQGVRPDEVARLEARHIDLAEGTATLPPGEHKTGKKTQRNRVIYLTSHSAAMLEKLIQANLQGPLFLNTKGKPWNRNSFNDRWKRLREKVGMPRLNTYAWRHTYITEALARGLSTAIVAELAGHADASMVGRVYAHMEAKGKEMKEAAQKAVKRR